MDKDKKITFADLSTPLKIGLAVGIPCTAICAFDKLIAEVLKLVSLITRNITRKKEGR